MIDRERLYRGNVYQGPEYMGGWVYAAIVCEAVRMAIGEVGVDNIDAPAMKTALESVKDFDIDGIAKITYGPDDRRGSQSYAVYVVKGENLVRVTDWRDVPVLVP